MISRRNLLTVSALVPVAACGLITTTTTNGVTTITVDVARADALGQAFISFTNMVQDLPGLNLGPVGLVLKTLGTVASADLAAFDKAAGGKMVLTFDSTSIPASLASLEADGKSILAAASTAIPAGANSVVKPYMDALQTAVALFTAMVGTTTMGAVQTPMTEGEALRVLGVRK